MCFKGLVCISVPVSRVSLDHFGFVLLVGFVGFGFFQYRAKRLAGKNVSEMAYSVTSGTLNLAPSVHWSPAGLETLLTVSIGPVTVARPSAAAAGDGVLVSAGNVKL